MEGTFWLLTAVVIENFKAIDSATIMIKPGFTIIAGPNGSGKSCFLESIGFGLGASLTELRVSNLAELCGKDRPGHRVRVELKFVRGSNVIIVGSSVAEDERHYLIANAKVTKLKFIQTITESLGFSKDSISWSVSQRAVQEIIKASPKKLFDTISFIAGTRSVLEARSHANQKVAQSEQQLVAVANLIIKLEGAVEEEKQILQLMSRREDIISSLINSQQGKQRCEEIYEAAKKYLSLITAKNLVKDLLADGSSELSLINKLNHTTQNINNVSQNAAGTENKRSQNSQQQTKRFGEMIITERLDEHRSELASANKSVSDTLLKISNLEKEVARLKRDLKEKKEVNTDIDTKIKYQKVNILEMGDELSLLLKVSIPQISVRIAALRLDTQIELHGASSYVSQKEMQVNTATQVAKLSESLLMAISASASHQQSLETGLERKLEKEKRYRDLLSDEILLLDDCCNHDKIQGVMIAGECTDEVHGQTDNAIDNILVIEDELRGIHRQLQSTRRMLNLPTKDDSSSDASDFETDGDHGFLADLLHISTANIVTENKDSDQLECTDINFINGNRFNTALDTIVGQKFSIKVCRDSIVAQRLMQNQELQGMRIWPIDRLASSTKRSDGYLEILKKYKNVAIDPISMVQICRRPQILGESERRKNSLPTVEFCRDLKFADLSMQRVLMKAVENWIIVGNDHDAGRIIQDKILSIHITGCVTLGGSKHRLGTLTTASKGSYHSQAKNRLDLPIVAQIKYRHLTPAYLKVKSRVNAFYRQKMELEESERQSQRLRVLQPLLVMTEKNIIESTKSLKLQIEKAAEAHRGLAIARLKLGEVEAHRDSLKVEFSKLVVSNEESVSQLFRDQERKTLDELISKRSSYEEKSSILTVSICEMNADRARHEVSMAVDSLEVQTLECRIAEITDQLIAVNKKLLACKSVQIINQRQYDNCEKLHIEKEAEDANLKSEIDDLRELFRQKVTQFFDNFTKYGQKFLAEKYSAHFCSSLNTEVQPFSKCVLYESMNGEEKLYQLISQDQDKSKQLIEDFVGEDQLCLLHENPQQCLRKFRESVVISRERILNLNQEASEIDKKLITKMDRHYQARKYSDSLMLNDEGLSAPKTKSVKRKQRDKRKVGSDSDSHDYSGSDNDCHSYKPLTKKNSEDVVLDSHDKLQRQESLMKEGILRKWSLLNALKQKYEQIKMSIAALVEGANSVERAVSGLHEDTYRALRQRCQRYFSDLVPGKKVDIVAVSPDGQVDKGLKFVLLDTVATADDLTSRRGASVSKVDMSDKVFGSKENINSHYRSHRSTEELSGGQRALLGLSFVFAAALHKRSPLYLLDEVDAALDETNQKIAGAVIAKIFTRSQVVCVSHHFGYQEQAATYIPVIMKDGNSVICPDNDV